MPLDNVRSNRITKYVHESVILAQKQAQASSQLLIEPEHLFLGILIQPQNQVVNALHDLGLSPMILAARVGKALIQGPEPVVEPSQLSSNTKVVIEQAFKEANVRGIYYVGTEHLALALTSDKEGTVARAIVEIGIPIERFHTAIFSAKATKARSEQERIKQDLKQKIDKLNWSTKLFAMFTIAIGIDFIFFSFITLMAMMMNYLPSFPRVTISTFTLATFYTFLSIPLCNYLAIAIHELGHWITASVFNFRLKALCIGNFGFLKFKEQFVFVQLSNVENFCGLSGCVLAFPKESHHLRLRHLLVSAGGPVASLLWCILLFYIAKYTVSTPSVFGFTILMCTMFSFAFYALVNVLIPVKIGDVMTDAMKIIDLLRGKTDTMNYVREQKEYEALIRQFNIAVESEIAPIRVSNVGKGYLRIQITPLLLTSLLLSATFYFVIPYLNLYQFFRH